MSSQQQTDLYIAADAAFFAGHFPGNPIVPGAYLLARSIETICANLSYDGPVDVGKAKFHAMVRPGDALILRWQHDVQKVRLVVQVCKTAPANDELAETPPENIELAETPPAVALEATLKLTALN